MAVGSLTNHYPLRATQGDLYVFVCSFDTNSTSAPDGVDPASAGFTVARASAGVFTITFDEDKKPWEVLTCLPTVVNDPTLAVQYTSYVRSTGVLTVTHYADDGTPAAADSNNKTIKVLALCTRNTDGIG